MLREKNTFKVPPFQRSARGYQPKNHSLTVTDFGDRMWSYL